MHAPALHAFAGRHPTMRRITTGLAAQLVACFAIAAHADSTIEVTVPSGEETIVNTHSHHNANCQPGVLPRFTMAQPPAHGKAVVREGEVIQKPNAVGTGNCTGTRIQGLQVVYTPDADFHGADAFEYDLRITGFPSGHVRIAITVQ